MALGNKIMWVTPVPYTGTGDFPKGPTPDEAKLHSGKDYPVVDIDYNEHTDECVILVVNDYGEIWSLSNRHLRVSIFHHANNISTLLFHLDRY